MKITSETRYFVTDIVAIPLMRLYKKTDAYKQATKPGWGVVDTDENGELFCDEDSSAVLTDKWGKSICIFPYSEINSKEFPKQADCKVIIQSDACGDSFYAEENDDVRIFVSYDENGFVDSYRVTDWTENPYDGEVAINFEDLPALDPYGEH